MRVVVCMKAVPASTEVAMDPVTHTIVRDGRDAVWNPYDTAALELALSLKDTRDDVWVGVVTMGIPATASLLEDALSRGADDALLLTDRAFAGSDTLATSYALSLGIRRLCARPDLVLCGKMAVDGDTAQIGPMLAAALAQGADGADAAYGTAADGGVRPGSEAMPAAGPGGLPCVTAVTSLEAQEGRPGQGPELLVCQTFEGVRRTLRLGCPAVLTVDKGAATLRMPSMAGVLAARQRTVPAVGADGLCADLGRCGLSGSPTQVVSCFVPESQGSAVTLEGTAAEQARAIADVFQEVLA